MTTAYFYTNNIIFDAPVSGNAKLIYAYLCKCADKDGKCYPSHKAIAAAAGISVTTVKKALAELENSGLISVQGQARPDRGRRANIYTVIKEKVNGFFMTYENVFTMQLTAKARLVYLYFCRLASGRDQAYPSHKTTAKACGLSVAGARAAIDELETAGLVARQAQYRDNGGQRANLYTIITEPDDVSGGDGNNGTDTYTETDLIEPHKLVGFHAECAGDPVNGDNRQAVDRCAFQVADSRVTQISFFSQFKLAHTKFFTKELDFEPDVFQKLVFFLRVGFSAYRHPFSSLRKLHNSLIYILIKIGLQMNVANGYNIVVKQHSHRKSIYSNGRQKAPPMLTAGQMVVIQQPG